MSDWISVEDKLPIDNEEVSTWNGECIQHAECWYDHEEATWMEPEYFLEEWMRDNPTDSITHWMPLPESPKEKDE